MLICLELLQDEQYDIIDTSFVNELLELVTDRTPNVRLWVGQALLLLQSKLLLKHCGLNFQARVACGTFETNVYIRSNMLNLTVLNVVKRIYWFVLDS